MGIPLLVEYYNELPEPRAESAKEWEERLRVGLEKFKREVSRRYLEGTLQRLVDSNEARTRRAAVLALGLVGTMKHSNAVLARLLRDEDRGLRQMAADALCSLWLRADSEANNQELERLCGLRDRRRKRQGLDALIERSPRFAEAYHQRALLHFQVEDWHKSISDCERVLKLNPHHFAAASEMGQCYMKLGKHRAALRAFRIALRINPGMEDVEETVKALENALGEEGRKDDKK